MPDPTTVNIQLAVPTRGSDVGTWDVPVNGDMTIIDACFGSVTTKSTTGGGITLTATEAQVNLIRLTGTLASNAALIIPTGITKSWFVLNDCTVGGFYAIMQNAAGGNVVGLPPGEIVQILSDGTNMRFCNLDRVGAYWDYAGASVPLWVSVSTVPPYLICDGTTFSSGTYPQLAAILGTTTLPDGRGRARFALNGGTGRITTAGSGIDGDTRFSAGGAQNVALDTTQIPSHTHTFSGTNATIGNGVQLLISSGVTGTSGILGFLGNILSTGFSYTPAGTNANVGGGLPHTNMSPGYIGGITLIRAA